MIITFNNVKSHRVVRSNCGRLILTRHAFSKLKIEMVLLACGLIIYRLLIYVYAMYLYAYVLDLD